MRDIEIKAEIYDLMEAVGILENKKKSLLGEIQKKQAELFELRKEVVSAIESSKKESKGE